MPTFALGRDRVTDPVLLRELAEEAFLAAGSITPPADARVVVAP